MLHILLHRQQLSPNYLNLFLNKFFALILVVCLDWYCSIVIGATSSDLQIFKVVIRTIVALNVKKKY